MYHFDFILSFQFIKRKNALSNVISDNSEKRVTECGLQIEVGRYSGCFRIKLTNYMIN